ncbi:hypothetical protein BKA83DRAFT_674001 [Pisolithus microcarpus]|nr:hypothetical protein BKA83DRAFT_674001 [Pisolithus microcarpus]
MSTAPPGYNYAKAYGIESVAGAVIFAIIYVPLFFLYVRQAIVRPTYSSQFFCAVRIAAFVLRALLAAYAQNLNLFITYEIMYNVGFFGLLGLVSDLPLPSDPISKLARRRMIFRLLLTAAVSIGITGVIEAAVGTTQHTVDIGDTLRKVSLYMFLILCILVAFQAILLVRAQDGTYKVSEGTFGAKHGIYVLCLISLLLVARQAFFAATVNDSAKQNNEHLWYPFAALPELCAPGLVPSLAELPS